MRTRLKMRNGKPYAVALARRSAPVPRNRIPLGCAGADATCSGTKSISVTDDEPAYISDGPSDYTEKQKCVWSVTSSGPLEIVFLAMKLESIYDFVKVTAGHSLESIAFGSLGGPANTTESRETPQIFTFTGPNPPNPFVVRGTAANAPVNVTIEFSSDWSIVWEGFVARLQVAKAPAAAPERERATNGAYIHTPLCRASRPSRPPPLACPLARLPARPPLQTCANTHIRARTHARTSMHTHPCTDTKNAFT